MKHKILYLFVAVAMLSACNDDLEDSTFTISEEVPAATWLKENGYSQWVSLLEYTNLYSTINLNAGDYTLFVPNNEAVNAYLSENSYPSVSSIDMDYAKLLVKYHTISGNQYSQVDFTNDVLPDTTATGDRLAVTFDTEGDYWVNNDAKITNFDIATTNATLFIIDKVLSPVTEYIYDRLENDTEWSLFKELLEATALDALVKQPTSGKASQYTLFVVPNSVFAAANISDLSALADTLNAAGIHTLHDETLNDYPSYTGSYANSRAVVQQYLAQYPSIKVVLDVHRDAIETEGGSRMAPVCTVDGRQAAQVMIICGCDNGGSVQLPDWRQNLRFAAAWERSMEGMYPGFTRPVLFSYRFYNQDLTTGSLLIEIGGHGNNLNEALYAGQLAANGLVQALLGPDA